MFCVHFSAKILGKINIKVREFLDSKEKDIHMNDAFKL